MRSCLIQVLLALAVLFLLVWFVLPLGVAALVEGALDAGGFTGTDTKVEVSANPPFMLLTGHADRVRLTSTQASMGDLHAASVDVNLRDVSLLSRSIETVDGTLLGVHVVAPNGDPVAFDKVSLKGAASATTATATLSVQAAQSLAKSQVRAQTGIDVDVALTAPDVVTLTFGGQAVNSRLVATNGALVLVPSTGGLAPVTLIAPASGNPLRVTSVKIASETMTLVGTLDVQKLLGWR